MIEVTDDRRVPVDLRLSALRIGSKANPRLVWGMGVNKDFLENIPENYQKVKLEQKGGQLQAVLGTEGVKLSQSIKGNFAWASNLGEHHLSGISVPDEEMAAQKLRGYYAPDDNVILFNGDLPESVKQRFMDVEALKKQADPESHFPATHFQEDIKGVPVQDTLNLDNPAIAETWFNSRVKMGAENIHTEQVMLTPALADVLIAHNDGNRPIRVAKLAQYVSDMANDRWEFNGETIIISREGLMNNGQHRSYAVQETGKSIPVLFVFGVDRDSRKTVDTGAMRGPHDQLSADGFPQPTTMAAVARFVLSYESNDGKGFANLARISGPDVYERAKSDPKIDEAAQFPYRYGSKAKRLAPPSVIGFCYYEFMKVNEQDAKDFLHQMITGVNLPADSAAYITREKLMDLSGLHREQKIELIFRGFLAFRKRKPVRGASIKVKWELPQL